MAKELKSRDQALLGTAIKAFTAEVEQQWIKRAPWMVYGVGLSLNEFDGLTKTAARTERSECNDLPRRVAKQAASKMWWAPPAASKMAIGEEGDKLFDRAWASLWDVESGGSNVNCRNPMLSDELQFIDLQALAHRHGTPLADEYLTAKMICYKIVGTIALHCTHARI